MGATGKRPGAECLVGKLVLGWQRRFEDKHILAANVPEGLLAQLLHMETRAPLPREPKTKLSGDTNWVMCKCYPSCHRYIQRLASQTGLYWEGVGSNLTSEGFPTVAIIKLVSLLVWNKIWSRLGSVKNRRNIENIGETEKRTSCLMPLSV